MDLDKIYRLAFVFANMSGGHETGKKFFIESEKIFIYLFTESDMNDLSQFIYISIPVIRSHETSLK